MDVLHPEQRTTGLWIVRDRQSHLLVQEVSEDAILETSHFTKDDWIMLYRARRRAGFPLTQREIRQMRKLAPEVLLADGIPTDRDIPGSGDKDNNAESVVE